MATKERFNVVFPTDVLNDLRTLVPARKRSEFVVAATSKELRRLRQRAVLERLRKEPAWKLEDHPDLVTVEDSVRYEREMRAQWRREPEPTEVDNG
jgi:hypothetical protein